MIYMMFNLKFYITTGDVKNGTEATLISNKLPGVSGVMTLVKMVLK